MNGEAGNDGAKEERYPFDTFLPLSVQLTKFKDYVSPFFFLFNFLFDILSFLQINTW